MKNISIRKRILFSFGFVVLVMAMIAGVTYYRLIKISDSASTVQNNSIPGLYLSTQIRTAWFEQYVLTQQLIAIDTQNEIRTLDRGRLASAHDRLQNLISDYMRTVFSHEERSIMDQFAASREQFNAASDELLRMDPDRDSMTARKFMAEKLAPAWNQAAELIQRLAEYNKQNADSAAQQIQNSTSSAQNALLFAIFCACLVAVMCGYFLMLAINIPMSRLMKTLEAMRGGDFSQRVTLGRKDEFSALESGVNRLTDELVALVSQAQKSSLQITSSVTQIAATAREQQATANETAATTTEIGATSREIFMTSTELAKTIESVTRSADNTALVAVQGQSGVLQMGQSMHSVMEAAGLVNSKLSILNEKASSINVVVTTIAKVAGQTNLLSLNAAIEAEKAGEYGRGFSVVATEIRRLADQTAVASADIEQIVKEIQSAISSGVMGMDKFTEEVKRGINDVQGVGEQLSHITQQVQDLSPQFRRVHEGMQRQAGSAEQINEALSQLTESAQQTVESLRQSSQAIDELTHTATGLRNGVSRFKLKSV